MATINEPDLVSRLDSFVDYNNNNGERMCKIRDSQTSHNITIVFYQDKDYDTFLDLLKNQYDFTETKNCKGISTTKFIHDQKVVITVFYTKTLLIQGSGCRVWLDTEFKLLVQHFNTGPMESCLPLNIPPQNVGCSTDSVNTTSEYPKSCDKTDTNTTDTPKIATFQIHVVPKPKQKSKKLFSFKSFRKKLQITSTPVKNQYSSPVNRDSYLTLNSEPMIHSISNDSVSEIQSTTSDTAPKCIDTSESFVPITCESETQTVITQLNSSMDIENKANNHTQCSQVCTKLQKENNELKTLNEQLNRQRSEKNSNGDIHKSELYAQILLLEDEVKSLKQNNLSFKQENKVLRKKLSSIETEKECLSSVQTDVSEVKEQIAEINGILTVLKKRTENVHSLTRCDAFQDDTQPLSETQRKVSSSTPTPVQKLAEVKSKSDVHQTDAKQTRTASNKTTPNPPTSRSRNSTDRTTSLTAEINTPTNHSQNSRGSKPNQARKPSILIIGDSVTKVIDPVKFSGESLCAQIKSHPGAKVADIVGKIDTSSIKQDVLNSDIVIVHAGINNISDAETCDTIVDQFKGLVSSIRTINQNVQLIISSILPKKHDKLSSKPITDLNKLLATFCKNNNILFLDNTQSFMTERGVNRSLYRDEVHLNPRGAAHLVKNMKRAIFGQLKNDTSAYQSTGNTSAYKSSGNFRMDKFTNHRIYQSGYQANRNQKYMMSRQRWARQTPMSLNRMWVPGWY